MFFFGAVSSQQLVAVRKASILVNHIFVHHSIFQISLRKEKEEEKEKKKKRSRTHLTSTITYISFRCVITQMSKPFYTLLLPFFCFVMLKRVIQESNLSTHTHTHTHKERKEI